MTHDDAARSDGMIPRTQRYASPGTPPVDAPNVHGLERILSAGGGAALVAMGLRRGGTAGVLQGVLGIAMIARSLTGNCPAKRALFATPYEKHLAEEQGWHSATAIAADVHIQRSRADVYAYWRNFNNLSHFMEHIARIEVIGEKRSRWVVKAPLGQTVEWIAHVTEDIPDKRIAWETEYDADVRSSGWVEFHDTADGLGTHVQAVIAYEPPGGRIGHLAASLWREDPATQAREDLARLKHILENMPPATLPTQPEQPRSE